MKRPLFYVVLFFCWYSIIRAEIIPADESIIHYTTVYFEEEFVTKAVHYRLEVQAGKQFDSANKMLFTAEGSYPAFHMNGFMWNEEYSWRITALNMKNGVLQPAVTHHFKISTFTRPAVYSETQLQVHKNNNGLQADGFIAIDYLNGIYDRSGNPIWMIPPINGFVNPDTEIRDLKHTPENTLTFMADNKPLEIDLHGNVLWSLPHPFILKGDTLTFHHEFQKKGDHYYVLANKKAFRKITTGYQPGKYNIIREVFPKEDGSYAKTHIAVILELDKYGRVVYSWDASSYIKDEDLNFKRAQDNFPFMEAHANGLGIDSTEQFLFLSFRDLSRIIKIDKTTSAVIASFGQKYPSGDAKMAVDLFRQQHDGRPTKHSTMLIFNNNGPRETAATSAVIELDANNGDLLFKFDLDFDSLTRGRSGSGGNVNELPNKNILVCAGQLNRIFEVTRQKQIAWDAFTVGKPIGDSTFKSLSNYRCSWVKELTGNNILLKIDHLKSTRKKILSQFDVINIGPIADAFVVKIFGSDGAVIYEEKLGTIESGKIRRVDINIKPSAQPASGGYLLVQSLSNSSSVKKLSIKKN